MFDVQLCINISRTSLFYHPDFNANTQTFLKRTSTDYQVPIWLTERLCGVWHLTLIQNFLSLVKRCFNAVQPFKVMFDIPAMHYYIWTCIFNQARWEEFHLIKALSLPILWFSKVFFIYTNHMVTYDESGCIRVLTVYVIFADTVKVR